MLREQHPWIGGYVHVGDSDDARSCFCRGPQNGQPLCPCQMQGVEIRNGRYVRVQDLGPVREDVEPI